MQKENSIQKSKKKSLDSYLEPYTKIVHKNNSKWWQAKCKTKTYRTYEKKNTEKFTGTVD